MSSPYDRPDGDLWIFAYGSLLWRPDFDYVEAQPVTIHGYHRALCIRSVEYRGTAEVPGLVFGLDRGGSCRGLAFRIAEIHADQVMADVWKREMITGIYRPCWVKTQVNGVAVTVWVFVAEPAHDQYAGKLSDAEIMRLVLQGRGTVGPCTEYVKCTFEHLEELGIHDRALDRIVRQMTAKECAD